MIHASRYTIMEDQAQIQLLTKGEVVKIMENNVFFLKQQMEATACHENEFRNQIV